MRLPRVSRPVLILFVLLTAAGATVRGLGAQGTPAASARPGPPRFGEIRLGHPLAAPADGGLRVGGCRSGRAWALVPRDYRSDTDAIVAGVVDAHADSADVLAALDSVTVCVAQVAYPAGVPRPFAFVTLVDGTVAHVVLAWSAKDTEPLPSFATLVRHLEADWGTPRRDAAEMRTWSRDGVRLVATGTGPYGSGPSLTLTDGRACRVVERVIHRRLARRAGEAAAPGDCWPPADLRSAR